MQTLLTSMLRYKAWADQELMAELARRGDQLPPDKRDTALRLLGHAHIVDRIFVAHLQRSAHGHASTEPAEVPRPEVLFPAIEDTDRWLVEHAGRLGPGELAEQIAFSFTDGFAGVMSREEMLGHLIAHGGYHRGEIGQILTQQFGSSPPDTFTGYLRRTRGESKAASSADQRFGSV